MPQSGKILQMAQKPTAKHTLVNDPQLAQLLQSYEGGLRAMQEHKYDKAKPLLQKVVSGANRELADRAAVHLNACNQQLERGATQFKTAEEHYDYAVSLMNVGDYVGARELRVVAIGGGTGLSTLLRGLKKYTSGAVASGADSSPSASLPDTPQIA